MVEVPVKRSPANGGARRAVPSTARPRATERDLATRQWIRSSPLGLSEARRAWNRDRIGLVADLRCECTRPSCRHRVPVAAEPHRRVAHQFVVSPAHYDVGVVVRAADRFFVVDLRAHGIGYSHGELI